MDKPFKIEYFVKRELVRDPKNRHKGEWHFDIRKRVTDREYDQNHPDVAIDMLALRAELDPDELERVIADARDTNKGYGHAVVECGEDDPRVAKYVS